MKKLALISCLVLAGCGTTSVEQVSERAKEIQNYTKLFCSFVPTIGTIANILSTGASAPAVMIATDICTAVTTAPLADGPGRVPKVTYNNKTVVIKGRFVK